jgi:hypothetical protein
VDVWLSTLPLSPGDKQAKGIFAKFGCGDSGNAVAGQMLPYPYAIPIPSPDLYVGVWAHNMRVTDDDFHIGIVLYYP